MGIGGFNLGLGSPGLGLMPNGLNMVQLAQLNGMNGIHPFGVNMNMLGMANLSAMGISPEAQLLAAQIAATGDGFRQPGIGGLGSFGGPQGGIGLRNGHGRSVDRSLGLGGGGSGGKGGSAAGNGGAKEEENYDPALLHGFAGWVRTLRLHKYTPNFEGMS